LLVVLALWAVPALAQQKWWRLARSSPSDPDSILDTCMTAGKLTSPGAFYEVAKTLKQSPEIADKGDEVDVTYSYYGDMSKIR
jgi:hypothetical protein